MSTLTHREGDLFGTEARALGHGVNTHGVMGAGIAAQFKRNYPDMYKEYSIYCKNSPGLIPGSVFVWKYKNHFMDDYEYVINLATQDSPGPNAKIEWVRESVQMALDFLSEEGVSVLALPRIGSGIGGLDQDEVEAVLTELAEASTVDIELWTWNAN